MSLLLIDVVPLSVVEVVTVIVEDFVLLVLDDGSLHNLQATLEGSRVQ